MSGIDWQDEQRTTVERSTDSDSGSTLLRGTETTDKNRANVFGAWRDEDDDEGGLDYTGRYYPASVSDAPTTEAEVRFAFYESEDIEDHAEVYLWQIYHWKLTEDGPVCTRDELFGGEFVVEAGGLYGPEAMYGPLVSEGVRRIRHARWDKFVTPTRVVGS